MTRSVQNFSRLGLIHGLPARTSEQFTVAAAFSIAAAGNLGPEGFTGITSGAGQVSSASTLEFGGITLRLGDVSIAASSLLRQVSFSIAPGAWRYVASTSFQMEGTQLSQSSALSINPTFNVLWSSGLGSSFLIQDDQTTMAPSGASVVSADAAGNSSLDGLFEGSDVSNFSTLSASAQASLTFDTASFIGADFSIPGTVAVTFDASPFPGADHEVNALASLEWDAITMPTAAPWFQGVGTFRFAPRVQSEGAFLLGGTAHAEFTQTQGSLSLGAFAVSATSTSAFTGFSFASGALLTEPYLAAEFGQPGGGVEFGALVLTQQLTLDFAAESTAEADFDINASSSLRLGSRDFEGEDDDLPPAWTDALRREAFEAAAADERRVIDGRRIGRINRIDEADLLVFAEALSHLVAAQRTSVRAQ